ncbi:TIGR03087 family PEP-CTERM/XrtA system glycosyltransferase [Arsukibacterium sp.]|uniref:TIGR03087 family PEP-CTERM/XrtA system glycosyltransferase n=1 Tax=Arsukibacterium sp. TaxID=1977258 RepID=UPI001BD5B4A5|nr:TIGR03087 family PEP-CTERM/XrtA system glycosyltransferase [Arsukibacterium sp.]
MKILYVCHRFPFPPKRGGKIRPFNMIRHFTEQGHQVYVASLARSPEEAADGEGIKQYCHHYYAAVVKEPVQFARMILRLPLLTPSSMGYFFSHDLNNHIKGLLAEHKFDLIFVHCSSVAQYVAGVTDTPKLLDFGDMDSQKWLAYRAFKPFPLSLGYYLEGQKMLRAEKRLARRFDLCSCTTKAELATLQSYNTQVPTAWFPNGVDTDYFNPGTASYEHHSISFIGRMDYYPNQEAMLQFCRQTLPLIREQIPDVKLYIVGAEPSAAIRALANLPGVVVTGSVPDVRPYIINTAAMVAPLNIARGTQNKILEAMAMAVPVVSSSQAAGGIDAIVNQHFLIADTPSEYANALVKLMRNPSYRQQLAEAGRQRMLTHHQWHLSMQQLDSIVQQCINLHQEKQLTQREVQI